MRALVRRLTLALSLAVLGCSPAGKTKAMDAARLTAADADTAAWMTTGRTYSEQRFSPLAAITAATVDKLGLAWSAGFDPDRGHEATPLMVDGVLYTTDVVNRGVALWGGKVFVGVLDGRLIVLDAKTGAEVWSVVTVDQSKPYTIARTASGQRQRADWQRRRRVRGPRLSLGVRCRDRHAGVAGLHHA